MLKGCTSAHWRSGKKRFRDVGQTLHNLGLVHAAQRKYSEAEGVYKRALAIRET